MTPTIDLIMAVARCIGAVEQRTPDTFAHRATSRATLRDLRLTLAAELGRAHPALDIREFLNVAEGITTGESA